MEIALHLGLHCTDEDRILACLQKNAAQLAASGTHVPQIGRYRPVIRQMLQVIKGGAPSVQAQQSLIDAMVDDDHAQRIVLSHDSFLGVPGRAVEGNLLYTTTAYRAPRLRALFAKCDVSFFLAIRDPATFIPAVFARAQETNFDAFMEGSDALTLRWSNMIARLREAVPDCPITVWCNEDTPLIWNDVLRAVSQHDTDMVLEGRDDFINGLMAPAGAGRLHSYLQTHPPQTEAQRRKVVAAFLDKYAVVDALEEEIDLPGWTQSYVAQLSARYEADLGLIRQLPGVTFIEP